MFFLFVVDFSATIVVGPVAVTFVIMTRHICSHPDDNLSVRLSACLSVCLSFRRVCQHAPHWASVSGFVIKKSHQSQQRADWLSPAPPTHSLICCQHYQRLLPVSPLAFPLHQVCHTIPLGFLPGSKPIERPLQPQSFPFRFHSKTNVMSDVSHLISFSTHSQLILITFSFSSNAFNEKGVDCWQLSLIVAVSRR